MIDDDSQHCFQNFTLQINRPTTMRKDGIQTRKRKPKPGKESSSHSGSKHKVQVPLAIFELIPFTSWIFGEKGEDVLNHQCQYASTIIEHKVIGPSLLLHQLSSSYSYLKDRMIQQEAAEAQQAASAAAAAAAVAAQQNAAAAYQTEGKELKIQKYFTKVSALN